MEKLETGIKKYFSHVEHHVVAVDKLLNQSQHPCSVLVNQSLLYQAVLPADSILNTEFQQFPGFRAALLYNIQIALDKEIVALKTIREELVRINQDLNQKQKSLENVYLNLRVANELDVTQVNPCYPRLTNVIEWSIDVWREYHLLQVRMANALRVIDLANSSSIKNLAKAFKEDPAVKTRVNKIRSFQFHNLKFLK